MKNIIIPVDFSIQSEFALHFGANLAKKYGATLHILHMLELSDSLLSYSDNKNEIEFMLTLANQKIEKFLDKDYLKGITVKPVIKHYKVYKEVDNYAKEINADMVVMGSHGLTIQDGLFAGSNVEKMVRKSSIPVLVIKSDPKDLAIKNIILATDLSPESVSAYKRIVALFTKLECNILPVYVNLPNNEFISSKEFKEMRNEFAAAGGTNEVQFIAGHIVEDGLIQYAEEIGADLIAVSTKARKGFSHFLKGSTSEDLANHSRIPIMTFKM